VYDKGLSLDPVQRRRNLQVVWIWEGGYNIGLSTGSIQEELWMSLCNSKDMKTWWSWLKTHRISPPGEQLVYVFNFQVILVPISLDFLKEIALCFYVFEFLAFF